MSATKFETKDEARRAAAVHKDRMVMGVMFDTKMERCVGHDVGAVVRCVATRNRGVRVCRSAAEVDAFVAEFGR